MSLPRVVLHVDMDAFYASVEQRDRPELRGKPVLVGGTGGRGVVTTASYEARVFGCRSAMPMARAMALCPGAIVVKPRMGAYVEASRHVREILERFSPDIEPISIDEAFVELNKVPLWRERSEQAAKDIKRAIRDELRLTASVGIGPNKFLAKVASDMGKPDGLARIRPDEAPALLRTMNVGVLLGVGKVVAAKLQALNIRCVGDLVDRAGDDTGELVRLFGDEQVAAWMRLSRGEDDRAICTHREARSIGKERTFQEDIDDPARLRGALMDELGHAARSLREEALVCRRVAIKLRRPDFTTHSRSRVLAEATDATAELWSCADRLLGEFLGGKRIALRLIGVRLEELSARDASPGLFDEARRQERSARVDAIADTIAAKFGERVISRAAAMSGTRRRGGGGHDDRIIRSGD